MTIQRRDVVRFGGLAMLLAALGGCATINEAPLLNAPLPAQWGNGSPAKTPFRQTDLTAWWTQYRDPVLTDHIQRALVSSPTLEQALARVDAARALARSEGASRFPRTDGSGNALYQSRLSGSSLNLNDAGEELGQGQRRSIGTFQAGFDTSWEVDLFGRVRNAVASAERNAAVLAEEAEVARVTLVAEIVRSYVELLYAQRRRAIISNDISAREQLVGLIRNQLTNGVSSDFDLQRATVTAQSARARLPTADLAIQTARQRIATLVGEPVADRRLGRSAARIAILRPPKATMPADLLRTRPEIRAAERLVEKRAADVGVAIAELYPRLTLSGTLTLSGNLLAKPLPGQLVTVAGGPALTIPLLDWGQRRAIVDARDAELREAIAGYRAAVLQGVEDVEVSLSAIRNQNIRITRLQNATSAARRAFATADSLFKSGLTGLTERLSAETELRQAELELAEAQELAGLAVVRLYKALGGPSLQK
jgi:outer membrane protein, multidrug efflux system